MLDCWHNPIHLSTDGKAIAKIAKIVIAGDPVRIEELIGSDFATVRCSDVELECLMHVAAAGETRILIKYLTTLSGVVKLE